MKSQKGLVVVSKLLVAVIAVVALAGASLVEAAALPNKITVRSQDISNGILTIDSVSAAQAGWVVVYKNANLTSGEIIGYAPVAAGVNTNVKVTLNTSRLKLDEQIYTLWVRLQADNGTPGLFEWGLRGLPYNDGPVVQNGAEVTAAFATAVASPSTATAASPVSPAPVAVTKDKITIASLEHLNSGVIEVNSIEATQAGWLVIYKESNYGAGEIVGYAPVSKGVNTNVKLTIDTKRLPDSQTTLWARLQADNGVPGLFEWGLHGLPYNDGPVVQNGQPVTAAFGIADW
jgi:hypothetical protein